MRIRFLRGISLLLISVLLLLSAGCESVIPSSPDPGMDIILPEISDLPIASAEPVPISTPSPQEPTEIPERDGYYYDVDHVVLYLYYYGQLPGNYLTKQEARSLGWNGGSVEKYRAGGAIGGDSFGNREGYLPTAGGRKYKECDIDTKGKDSRGAKRLIYSNDGLFFYTKDHYETFTEIQVTKEGALVWK